MPFTIEFYFETVFEDMLLDVWDTMADAGVPSYYQARGVRPHLTLAVLDHGNETQLRTIVNSFSQSLPLLSVTFVDVVLMPGDRCGVCLEPIVTTELLNIQAALYRQLCASANPPVDRYAPGRWIPRGSISKNLSFSEALHTVEICGKHLRLGPVRIHELGFAEFNPRRQIATLALPASG